VTLDLDQYPHRALPLLYVDDEPANLEVFRLHFEEDFTVHTALNAHEGLTLLESEPVALVASDERMPGMCGIEFLSRVSERWPDTFRMIISAYGDADRLFRAMNVGHAHEYVLKPWKAPELRACLDRGLAMAERRRELSRQAERARAMDRDASLIHDPATVVGSDGGLRDVLAAARKVAASDATVLIRGETGTGKELLARVIHQCSPRAAGPFVTVNCSAITETLLHSELFGHEKGAFTGAHRRQRGRFELAQGGTILLDEIGDIAPSVQLSLLRVLQERTIERVGGGPTVHLDVRVVAATNAELEPRVADGRFRSDLFYRLNVVPLQMPPLRERPEDVEPLVRHFVAKYASPGVPRPEVEPAALQALRQYAWPGNVRELENLVQRAMILAPGQVLTLADFTVDPVAMQRPTPREEAREEEQEVLREVLRRHGGNCSSAARELGLPRTTLVSRAKKFGLV